MDFRKRIAVVSIVSQFCAFAGSIVLAIVITNNPFGRSSLSGGTFFIAGMLGSALIYQIRACARQHDTAPITGPAPGPSHAGGWMAHLPSRKLSLCDEAWAIHDVHPRGTISLEEGLQLFAPEWRECIRDAFETCARDGRPYDIEVEVATRDGPRKWVRLTGTAQRGEKGRINRVQGTVQDIDERKRLTLSALKLEFKFAESLEGISDAFFHVDCDWRFTYLNREAERLLERKREALLGKLLWDEFPEAADGIIGEEYRKAVASQQKRVFEVFYGRVETWFSIAAYPSVAGLTVFFHDVTERRAFEQQLKLLEMAVSKIKDFVIMTDASSGPPHRQTILYVNDAFVEITGYSREEAIGRSPSFLQGDKTQESIVERIDASLRQAKPIRAELINYAKDGHEYWVELSIAPILDTQGKPTHFVATGRDISERRKAEEVLAESEERFRIIAMVTTDAVWDWDMASNTVRWNDNISSLFGHDPATPEQAFAQWEANVHPDDRTEVLANVRAAIAGSEECWQMEYRFQRGDGSFANVLDQGHIIRNGSGAATRVVGGIRDITESRAIEAKRLQTQRLEAIGKLTGGVAHDFNNLLTVIIGTAETLTDELPKDDWLWKTAELNRRASEHGAALTRQLLTFAGRQPLEPKVLDLNNLIAGIEELLLRAVGGAIDMTILPGAKLWSVKADAAQLESSILNLCLNARDAMSSGGQLMVRTENIEVERSGRHRHLVSAGQYVVLSIADDGEGMDAEAREQAFEPFFTTKEFGKGSGLGLSMVYGFVKQSGGHVEIDSRPAVGTTVSIYLPRADDPEFGSERLSTGVSRGSERVLIVEDDQRVRDFTEQFLKTYGYHVDCASDADEAIKILSIEEPFDLVFTDIVMPGAMNGSQLEQEIRRLHPDLPVLLTTGFADLAEYKSDDLHFIGKPYTRRQLSEKMREILDARRSSDDRRDD
ncbi:hybrid sensor histidine kinase/response regulator [Rhizobium jaguaris]|uniref:histidine kinase n=1 Tax=Rhizobium jaguaris TaxID=1312183 RepID=A0A387G232_9HYPH|nr:PAS domain-containing sensor histidine kinase [Rhizobium jaguaris]AYG62241.1 PAS domain S-box protein [Rhizobium jaguaris]